MPRGLCRQNQAQYNEHCSQCWIITTHECGAVKRSVASVWVCLSLCPVWALTFELTFKLHFNPLVYFLNMSVIAIKVIGQGQGHSSKTSVTKCAHSQVVCVLSIERQSSRYFIQVVNHLVPAVPNCYCLKRSTPYWSNPPVFISDIRALWRSGVSARVSKIKTGGLDQSSMAKCKAKIGGERVNCFSLLWMRSERRQAKPVKS